MFSEEEAEEAVKRDRRYKPRSTTYYNIDKAPADEDLELPCQMLPGRLEGDGPNCLRCGSEVKLDKCPGRPHRMGGKGTSRISSRQDGDLFKYLPPLGEWAEQAACKLTAEEWEDEAKVRERVELFFLDGRSRYNFDKMAQREAICRRCPVRTECQDYAADNNILFGWWGSSARKTTQRRKAKRRNG